MTNSASRHRLPLLAALLLALVHQPNEVGAADPTVTDANSQDTGPAIYTNCSACHGAMGEGSLGPALAANAKLAATDYVVAFILNGSGTMPSFREQLSDAEIASVATTIRTQWGNRFGGVKQREVTRLR